MSVHGAGTTRGFGSDFPAERTDGPRAIDATGRAAGADAVEDAPTPAPAVVRGGSPLRTPLPASTEPLSSILSRGDAALARAVMDDVIAGKAPESRLVEVMGLLAATARGNSPAGRLLGALGAQTGLDMQRVMDGLMERGAWRDIRDAGGFSSDQVSKLAKGGEVDALRRALIREDLRDAVDGSRPDAIDRIVARAGADKAGAALLLTKAIGEDKDLRKWVEKDQGRLERAQAIAIRAQPTDPSVAENRAVDAKVDAFRDWDRYPYALIAVPGYTPTDAVPAPGVHAQTRERLEMAKRDLDNGKAPFILVSGGNVHPEGTPFHEALEMKKELIRMGVPADRIIVDAAARHSTTNLRNTGRYMHAHGIGDRKALITTTPLQDFYFSNPGISTFHMRSKSELGYKVGELKDAPGGGLLGNKHHTSFQPARIVSKIDWTQPLDP